MQKGIGKVNIAAEKIYCYEMMRDITNERRRLSEMYMSLFNRVNELNRLEEQGVSQLATTGFSDHEALIQIPNIKHETDATNNIIKKVSEEIAVTTEEIPVTTTDVQVPFVSNTTEEIIGKLEQMTPDPVFEQHQAQAVKEFEYKQADPEQVAEPEEELPVSDYDNGTYTGIKIGADKIKRYQIYYTCDNSRCRHKGKRFITPEQTQVYCRECANKMRVKPATSKGFPNCDSFNNFFIAGNRITEEEVKAYANPIVRIEDVLTQYEKERTNFTNIRITTKKDNKAAPADAPKDKPKTTTKPSKPSTPGKPGPKPGTPRGTNRVSTGLKTVDASVIVESILKENGRPLHWESLYDAVVLRTGATELTKKNFNNNFLTRIKKINPKVILSAEKGFYEYKK